MKHAIIHSVSCRIPLTYVSLLSMVVCLAFNQSAFAQLPATELNSIFPPGGKQGTSFEATITGKDLDDVQTIQFSDPGITAQPKMSTAEFGKPRPEPNKFMVNIAGNVAPGIYEARVIGRFGISNPRAFAVGSGEEVIDDGSNKSFEKAREVQLGVVVNGRVDGGSRDYFKIPLKSGQRVLISAIAAQLDSRLDSTLAVFDESQRELARNRDAVGTDALIDFTAPADGVYTIGLYDFVYAGGNDYFYRFAVHAQPHVDFVFPPAGVPGQTGKFTLYGRNLPGGTSANGMAMGPDALQKLDVQIALPGDEATRQKLDVLAAAAPRCANLDGMSYQHKTPSGETNAVMVYYAQAPIVMESQANDSPTEAQKVSVPCEFVGQFYPERDVDWVQFDAKKGDVFQIDVICHQMGLDCDPVMRIERVTKNDKGEEQVTAVAAVDDPSDRNTRIGTPFDTSTDDPSYRLNVPDDGTYRVFVRDQFGDGQRDPRSVYRLVIRPQQPDFRLLAVPVPNRVANNNQVPAAAPTLYRGGTTILDVFIDRRDGFDGEIAITAEGLPAGVTCSGAIVGGTSNKTSLIIEASDQAQAWVGPIQVVGKAKVEGKDVSRRARAGATVWGTTNKTQLLPHFRLARDLTLAVVDKHTEVASVQAGEAKVWETSRGGKLEIPLKVTRRGDFKADIKLTPVNVPNEFKPKDVTIKGNAADGKLELAITNNNTKPGAYTFYLKGDVKFKHSRNPEAEKVAAEQQKELDAAIKDLTAKSKAATDAKNAATAAAQKEANVAKQKADELKKAQAAAKAAADNQDLVNKAKAAEQASKDATAKNEAAQQAKTAAEAKASETAALLKKAQDAKKVIDKRLADLKNANKPKDITASVFSTPIKLKIANSPMKPKVQSPGGAMKQGAKATIPVSFDRLYGFEDQVECTLEPPKGIAGISAKKVTIAKGQNSGNLELTLAANATPGDHEATVRFRGKFNNVTVDATEKIQLKVEAVEKSK